MSQTQIYILLFVGLVILAAGAIFFLLPYFGGQGALSAQARGLKGNINSSELGGLKDTFSRVSKVGVEGGKVQSSSSALTIEKKLKYARWTISPKTFRILAIIISVCAFIFSFLHLNILYQVVSLLIGNFVMNSLVMRSVNKRFKAFDNDYAPFLLSLVGLLKTGMNPLQAIGTAAEGLEDESLVRLEVEVMLERLRLGVSEDKSIGAFGEDILHPEIELFVQALLLSRRVGGTLSDTLDRLAKQVRRRQYFRLLAVAAVGLQRGSVWFILAIQVGLLTYIYMMLPVFVTEAYNNPTIWQLWQCCVGVMIGGILWVRKVSNIRV